MGFPPISWHVGGFFRGCYILWLNGGRATIMECSKKQVAKNLDTLRIEVCQKCPGLFWGFWYPHFVDGFFRGF